MSCNFDFRGRTAMVTGAGRGIGRVIVDELVRAGAKVIAVSKTQSNLDSIRQRYSNVTCVQVDLSNWEETKEKLTSFENEIDYLVNNAGYAQCLPFGNLEERSMDIHFDLNVKSAINVTQIVSKGMKVRKFGSVVNISSVAGLFALNDHTAYGISKAGLDMATKSMALELGPLNIRVNSVNPTVTETEMALVGWSEESQRQKMLSKIPLGRFVAPIEVAKVVLFLLSDASAMITAALLPIDGGATNTSP